MSEAEATGQIDAGDGGGAGEGSEEAGDAGGDSVSRLTQAFETFQGDISSRFDRLEKARAEPEMEGDEEGDDDDLPGVDFEFADEDFDEQGQVNQEAQMRELAKMMRAVAREENAPILAAREDERRMAEADALEERYPQLADSKYQDEIVEKTVAKAKALGKPELAREPKFLEMVHLEEVARQGAAAETPAGRTQGATLERGGAAAPAGGKDPSEEEGDRIVAAATKGRFRLGT